MGTALSQFEKGVGHFRAGIRRISQHIAMCWQIRMLAQFPFLTFLRAVTFQSRSVLRIGRFNPPRNANELLSA